MSASVWDNSITVIYFFYGLAFYSMGLALVVESGRASELGFARSMRLLAAFGLLHGLHEWIDMLEWELALHQQMALPEWTDWLRLVLLVTSFVALTAFGEHLLARERRGRDPQWYFTISLMVLFAISAIVARLLYDLDDPAWTAAMDVLARYLMGIPGALVACWALLMQRATFRARGMGRFERELVLAALALALYGIVGQLFTRQSAIFPSPFVNAALFQQLFGFPVQLFRAAMATLVAYAMIRVLRALEIENEQRLEQAERAKQEAERRSREQLARLNTELQAANEETARLLQEVRRRDALRGELLQRITAAQEAERKRIARELHDDTGQHLTGLALGLRGLVGQVKRDPDRLAAQLTQLEGMATDALGELRHLINDLRPPQLDDMGLVAALRFMVNRFAEREAVETTFTLQGDPQPLPAEVETTVFRIAQEGLTNTIKHAQAKRIDVRLDFTGGLTLTVHDDGIGFDPAAVLSPDSTRSAWGLLGMQERATLIDASLKLDSTPGAGTTLTIHLEPAVLATYREVPAARSPASEE